MLVDVGKVAEQIQKQGYGITGSIGGIARQKYWTPDGREIMAIPNMREFRDNQSMGTRDANLDNGWLLQKPTELKVRCPHCDKWHDTTDGVEQCGKQRAAFIGSHQKKVEKEILDAIPEVSQLRQDIANLKEMLAKLLERDKV